ncbi:sigma factor-like helix-turn-helix DNA-binding protein, partial [Alicyclobacillus sendaiensis]
MRDVTRVGDLYAFYEPLLTERQRQIVELYHFEDMSLGEIAE